MTSLVTYSEKGKLLQRNRQHDTTVLTGITKHEEYIELNVEIV